MFWENFTMDFCNLKGIIFDLDGTLLDSMWVWEDVDFEFLSRHNLPIEEDYVRTIAPMGFKLAAEYTKNRYQLSESVEEIVADWNRLAIEKYKKNVMIKPLVREFLQKLQDNGVKMAVATASHAELFMPALVSNKIDHFFESITTVDEVARGKGYPDIYLRAAEKMKLEPHDCAVFEDILPGIKAAKEGGFFTVAIAEAASDFDNEELKNIADKYIISFEELI